MQCDDFVYGTRYGFWMSLWGIAMVFWGDLEREEGRGGGKWPIPWHASII